MVLNIGFHFFVQNITFFFIVIYNFLLLVVVVVVYMGDMGPQDLTALCAFGFHSNGSCIKIQACCKKQILEIYLHTKKNCP